MTLISYAQNYEDVMLNRALKDIDKGFYIDVGANDPVVFSVTKSFYERGWRGINIEPIYKYYERLVSDRPEDINLPIAISAEPGLLRMYDVLDTGLSTFDSDIAATHAKNGYNSEEVYVPCLTLNSVLAAFPQDNIHFLKIDVEGAEKQVLESIDLTQCRPWIILSEATKPLSQDTNYKDWESILLSHDYQFVYFDGLNRFYVANEHPELLPAFSSPPNIFDGFVLIAQVEAELREKAAEARAREAETQTQTFRAQAQAAIEELQKIYISRSWRLTRPLRETKQFISIRLVRLPRTTIRWFVVEPMTYILRSRALHKFVAYSLKPFPALKDRLKNIAFARGWLKSQGVIVSQSIATHSNPIEHYGFETRRAQE
ncbi:FkbM family methyltransferase [Acidithiobacillus ferridurans]|uniref:FkbM family methyltransferase n=1 Tax=Acidithiobacillus ferridurans TaxID=1232575 RepID=UPI001C075D3E|nr:FkbM family methyltransferase [Acidithiobacillus ferridurans]MBU2804342.1 FkbM family methyltransferase [Acidithiobacillus ferridurans]